VLAEENGLTDPDAPIEEGTVIQVPNEVLSLSNSSGSFKPFNIADAIGDTQPTQPAPPRPKKKGCGVLGQILMIVVAIVVTYFTAGATSGFFAGALGSTGGAVATAATAAAAGSIASQGVGIAIGAQDSFSWKAVATAALTAGITQGIGLDKFDLIKGASGAGAEFVNAAARGLTANAIGQGVNIAMGLQKSFDWRGVVSAALEAPLASYIGDKFQGERFTTWGPGSIGHTMAHAALGAGIAAIRGQDPWAGAIGGASEALFSGLLPPGGGDFFDQTLRGGVTQLAAAGVAAAFGRDPMAAAHAAQNAYENNYLRHAETMRLVDAERRLRRNPNDQEARALRDRLIALDHQRDDDLEDALLSGDTERYQQLAADAAHAALEFLQLGNPFKYFRVPHGAFDQAAYQTFEQYGQKTLSMGSLHGYLSVNGWGDASHPQLQAWADIAKGSFDLFARLGRGDFGALFHAGRPDHREIAQIGGAWFYEENRFVGTLDNVSNSALAALGVAAVGIAGGDAETMYRVSQAGAALGGLMLVAAASRARVTIAPVRNPAAAGGLSPRSFGLQTIAEDPQLLRMWNDAMRSAASSRIENGYQRYLQALSRGETPSQRMLEDAFGSVNSRFVTSARGAGYNIAEVHHWNYGKTDNPTLIVDPRNLVPVPSRAMHIDIHRQTSSGTNFFVDPIAPQHRLDIQGWYTPLAPRPPVAPAPATSTQPQPQPPRP
jgi:hypothetical protein